MELVGGAREEGLDVDAAGGGAEARYSLVSSMRLASSSLRLRYSAFVGSFARASWIWEAAGVSVR